MRTWFPDVGDDDQQTPFCNNANCAVRAEAWRALPYDETLTGLEDLDWAKRALAAGWKLVYDADARVAHIHNEPFAKTRNRYRREAIAHRRIFHDQHVSLFEALGSVPARRRARLPRRRRPPSAVVEPASIPRFRAAQYLGTWEGFRHRGEVSTVAAPALLLPERFHRPRPVLAERPMSALRRRLRADAPQQRARAGQELPPVQRRAAVPPHRVDAARRRADHQGRHRHRQPDRQGAGRRRRSRPSRSSTAPPTCSAVTCR